MDYLKIYNRLCRRAVGRTIDVYTERHHIIPRCMQGTDDLENLVHLTPEEHFLAHQLLIRIYPENKGLIYAAQLMTQCSNGKRINNKLFGWIKRRISSDRINNNPSKRLEVRTKISNSLKGNIPWNKGLAGSQIAWNKGIGHSEKTKNKLKETWIKRKENGYTGTFTGKHHTEETKQRLRILNTGKKGTPSNKKGKPLSAETKEKMKLSQQKRRKREHDENNN
jgi:hypothetical protein